MREKLWPLQVFKGGQLPQRRVRKEYFEEFDFEPLSILTFQVKSGQKEADLQLDLFRDYRPR